jgi:glutamine amidotransferase
MLLWQRLDQGRPLELAVVELLHEVVALDPQACLNLLATDGARIVATTWGETLCYRREADGVLVASEPHDDAGDWTRVPDRRVVVADTLGMDVRTLSTDPDALTEVPPAGDAVG